MDNFNLDLIFAIPGQDLDMWEADLAAALAARPAHLSTYCLTFEEDTALWLRLQRGQVRRRDADDEARFFERAWDYLRARGFEQYEVSNFARPGHACLHNVNTWRMQEWIGVGPSASSQFGGRRWTEPHSLEQWLEGLESGRPRLADETPLSDSLLAQDFLIFGLRMNAGIDEGELARRFGAGVPAGWKELCGALVGEGLARRHGNRVSLTDRGRLVADRIGAEILGMA
jgi:oxygen-independent coproporphyrinogen-3 oxidase